MEIINILTNTAMQILSLVAPTTSRVIKIKVNFCDEDTAFLKEYTIHLPRKMFDCDVTKDTMLAVGLLMHEIGHLLQPLQQIDQIEEEERIPSWLSNIALDIQLEEMIKTIFLQASVSLQYCRQLVHDKCYRTEFANTVCTLYARNVQFQDIAEHLALASRFYDPMASCGCCDAVINDIFDAAVAVTVPPVYRQFLCDLEMFRYITVCELPERLRWLISRYPELRTQQRQNKFCARPQLRGNSDLIVLQEEAADYLPTALQDYSELCKCQVDKTAIIPEAYLLANRLTPHFQAGRSAQQIIAPLEIERRQLAAGAMLPFYMNLPGRISPYNRLIICLDCSPSMKEGGGSKLRLAQIASQAIALAIKRIGGQVIGIAFGEKAYISTQEDDSLLFAEHLPTMVSTDFAFLPDVWQRWPHVPILLITDGHGRTPCALPGNKARTHCILIPPRINKLDMENIATTVIVLSHLAYLSDVIAFICK